MSYTEFHTGILHKEVSGKENVKEHLKMLAKNFNVDFDDEDGCEDWKYDVPYEIYKKHGPRYIVINDDLYIILKYWYCDEDSELWKTEQLENGDISFMTQFYNGGTDINEIVKDIVNEYERK